VKSECLPHSQIPHTTRLFTDFLSYSSKVQPFYPHSPYFSEWLKQEASVLQYDPDRRERVAAVLERQNQSWGASPKTLENVARFRAGKIQLGRSLGIEDFPLTQFRQKRNGHLHLAVRKGIHERLKAVAIGEHISTIALRATSHFRPNIKRSV